MKASHFSIHVISAAVALALPLPAAPACGVVEPIKPIKLEFDSREAVASLIGFVELTNPSLPPKKYLRQSITGTLYRGRWPDGTCALEPVPFSWSRSRVNDAPPGYPYGTITWSASLTPVSTTATGVILYRAQTQIQGPEPMTLRIFVDLGNSGSMTFLNNDEKYIDPFSFSPPFNAVAVCPQLSGWGASLTNASGLFVPKHLDQLRDEWNVIREYDDGDWTGTTFRQNTDASARYSGRVFEFPTTSGDSRDGVPKLDDYAGLVATTLSSTERMIVGTEVCNLGRKATGTYRETLSGEDTEKAAEERAPIILGHSATAYRTKRTTGFSFGFRVVDYAATFDIACPGDYLVTVRYSVKPHDAAVAGTPRALVRRQNFPQGITKITGTLDPEEKDLDYTIEGVEATRPCADEVVGEGSYDLGSVRVRLSLGRDAGGFAAGSLLLDATTLNANVYSPISLAPAIPAGAGFETIRGSVGMIRQVKTPQALADVVVPDGAPYEVRFYLAGQVGAKSESTGLYAVSGAPLVVYRFENPELAQGQMRRLRITEIRDSSSKVTDYEYDPTTVTWSLKQGGGLRQESETTAFVSGDTVKTRTVRDENNRVVAKVARTYRTFPWREELIREVVDPDGAALTTVYEFYDAVALSDPNYGRLRQRTEANGNWERFTYDVAKRVLKSIRPFLDAPSSTTDEALCRVTENGYDTVADADGDGLPETRVTTIERTLGRETSRRYRIDWSKPVLLAADLCQRRSSIVCTSEGATWNAADNLVTETLMIPGGTFAGRERRVVNPDGTATITSFVMDANGILTTTGAAGQLSASGDSIVDGRRTIALTDARGQRTSESVTDVATGLTLSRWIATETDAVGRPARIDFDDGTYVRRTYACCGLEMERDRSGLVTNFGYDALGRQVTLRRQGITIQTVYDADGRVTQISRIGTDGTEIVQEKSTYDLAGRATERRDAVDRRTIFAVEIAPGSGQTTRTTTLPGGATSIEVTARDGSRVSVGGTATPPHAFEYGVDATGVFTKEVAVGVGANNEPTYTEWVKAYTDFAGRSFKVVYADNAAQQSFYNTLGQLVRQVDADGVTILYAYNARGEQEVVATDMNGNNAIDYAGLDRITRRSAGVALRNDAAGSITVVRTTTQRWEAENQDVPTTLAIDEQSADGLHSWHWERGLTTATVMVYDGAGGRTQTTTAPDGTATESVYAGDQLLTQTQRTASGAQLAAVTMAYDPHGRLQTRTDARNGATTYLYFPDDQVMSVTTPDPDLSRSGPGYDPQTTSYFYDSTGRVATVTNPDGTVVNTTYWPSGAIKRVWGARTFPTEYAYDSQGRLQTLSTWQSFAANAGRATTTWLYDPARGFLANKRYADGTGPTYSYKPSGRLLSRTWARIPSVTTTYTYTAAGELREMAYSDGTPTVKMVYDRAGRPIGMSDGAGERSFGYHASDQLALESYDSGPFAGMKVSRTFDALDRPTALAASGVPTVTYTYDAASRLERITRGASAVAYSYLSNSALVGGASVTEGTSTRLVTMRNYDRLERLTAVNSAFGASGMLAFAYTYDAANQRAQVTREDNSAWSYGYDGLGQVISGRRFLAGNTPALGSDYMWNFDDIGNRAAATVNGTTSLYTANSLNQYTQRTVPGIVDVLGAAQPSATVTVGLNNAAPQPAERQGETFFKQLNVDNAVVAQNAQVRVTGVRSQVGANGEDAVTEIVQSRLVPKTPELFAHDVDGNLVADGAWLYTWDAENRLVAVETNPLASAAGVAGRRLEFAYDGTGRRFAKKVFNFAAGTWVLASHTLFLYDGWHMVAELNALAGHAPIRTYVWGLDVSGSLGGAGGIGGLISVTDGATSTTHFAAYDGNGNVAGLVNAATGALSAKYDYQPFGEVVQSEGTFAASNPFKFSTKYTDAETGHVYFGYRYYEPGVGRWLSRDPMGESGGENLYGFVGNSTSDGIDLLGLAGFFFDGTGNNAKSGTNVRILWNLYESQNKFYYPGVGSSIGTYIIGGLTGAGGGNRLRKAYQDFLSAVESGDRYVDIVGFSRGASLAREFANLISERGYDPSYSGKSGRRIVASNNIPPTECEFVIRFVGLFDTVGSFGIPGNDTNIGIRMDLPTNVVRAAQATSQDERRFLFPLTPLRGREGFDERSFPGDHSDIGRGHEEKTNDLSRAPLEYIWNAAKSVNVPFLPLPSYVPTGNVTPHDLSKGFPYNIFPKRPRT